MNDYPEKLNLSKCQVHNCQMFESYLFPDFWRNRMWTSILWKYLITPTTCLRPFFRFWIKVMVKYNFFRECLFKIISYLIVHGMRLFKIISYLIVHGMELGLRSRFHNICYPRFFSISGRVIQFACTSEMIISPTRGTFVVLLTWCVIRNEIHQ